MCIDIRQDSLTLAHIPNKKAHVYKREIINQEWKQVRQQDAYLAIRPAYPLGCCTQAAKGDKTYLQPVFLHR